MNVYKITIKLPAPSKEKAKWELRLRVPQGEICTVRKDNGKKV